MESNLREKRKIKFFNFQKKNSKNLNLNNNSNFK